MNQPTQVLLEKFASSVADVESHLSKLSPQVLEHEPDAVDDLLELLVRVRVLVRAQLLDPRERDLCVAFLRVTKVGASVQGAGGSGRMAGVRGG